MIKNTATTGPKAQKTEYTYHKLLFDQQFLKLTHEKINLERVFRPGVTGYPVLDSFPFVFWKSAWILHPGAHRQADQFFVQLYNSFIYECRRTRMGADQDRIIVALVLYAVWRFKPDWIYSMSDLVRQGQIVSPSSTAVIKIACLLSCLQGELVRAELLVHQIQGSDKYFEYMYKLLTGREIKQQSQQSGSVTANISVKRLLWFDAAINQDYELEQQLFRKFTKNAPVDEEDLLDVYATLLSRGHLFRAQRLLFKHCRFTLEKPRLLYAVLHHYLINGKYLLFLRRLAKMEKLPFRQNWYTAIFCIMLLEDEEHSDQIIDQLFSKRSEEEFPKDESSMEQFKQAMLAAARGITPNPLNPEYLYDLLVLRSLFEKPLLPTMLHDDDIEPNGQNVKAQRVRTRFATFERILVALRKRNHRLNIEQLALFFPVLEDKFRLYERKKSVQILWPVLNGLAGRSLPVRKFLGLSAWRREFHEVAGKLLCKQVLLSTEQIHASAEVALETGNHDLALKFYQRLLGMNPGSALLNYNYALLLERCHQPEQAIQIYQKVLDLEPGFMPARDKLELLS